MHEIITLAAFYALALGTHAMHAHAHKLPEASRVVGRHRFAAIITVVTHPTVLDTLRDYAVHFVVYSGYVLGH